MLSIGECLGLSYFYLNSCERIDRDYWEIIEAGMWGKSWKYEE